MELFKYDRNGVDNEFMRQASNGRLKGGHGEGVQMRIILTLLLGLSCVFLAPIAWALITALKEPREFAFFPVQWLPRQPRWSIFLIAVLALKQYIWNTLVLSSLFAALTTLTSAMVGFAFARLKGWGKRRLFLMMLSTVMLPPILTIIPSYVLFAQVGLIYSYWPWVLWGLGSSPFLCFLFRQAFAAIPYELEEAAIIDGCSYWRMFWLLFLPLCRPVVATVAILSFLTVWNDWLAPSVLLDGDSTTLAVALSWGGSPNYISAAALISILPVLALFASTQRYFTRSVVFSGLKG